MRAAVFVLLFAVLLRLISNVMVYLPGQLKTRVQGFYAEPQGTLDVVYLGASAVHTSFIPAYAWREQGFASYNFSTDLQPVEMLPFLISEAVARQPQALLVIDIRLVAFSTPDFTRDEVGIRNVSDTTWIRPSLNRPRYLYRLYPLQELSYYLLPIGKYHDRWRNGLTQEDWSYLTVDEDTVKGYFFEDTVAPQETPVPTDARAPLGDYELRVLDDLLAFVDTLDQQVLFVVSPYALSEFNQSVFHWMEDYLVERGYDFLARL